MGLTFLVELPISGIASTSSLSKSEDFRRVRDAINQSVQVKYSNTEEPHSAISIALIQETGRLKVEALRIRTIPAQDGTAQLQFSGHGIS